MKLKNKAIIVILFLAGISSCLTGHKEDKSVTKRLWEINQIVDAPGVYYSCEYQLLLQIKIEDDMVKFKVSNKLNGVLFNDSECPISNFHGWYFLLDESGTIWIENSDVGTFFAKRKSAGNYYLKEFGELNKENVHDLPEKIYSSMPEDLRKKIPR